MEKKDKVWAYIIGTGLVLFAVHNPDQPLLQYVFLPVLGLMLSLLGVAIVLHDHRKELSLGSKAVYIPLAVVCLSIALSGFINSTPQSGFQATLSKLFAPALFGLFLFGLYLVSRILGRALFAPMSIAVVIESASCIAYGLIMHPGTHNGGIISFATLGRSGNYDIAAGLMVFGLVVSAMDKRWWLSAIAVIGLFACGAGEGFFALGVLGLMVLIRRDWSKRILVPVWAVALLLVIGFSTGAAQGLLSTSVNQVAKAKEAISADSSQERDELLNEATGDRWLTHWRMPTIRPLGYGYNLTQFYEGIPHNILLIITHQVGPVAAGAWLFATVWVAIKSKWYYAFAGVLALGVFDHYWWTQVAPWWWTLIGVSSANAVGSDLIFKEARQ